MGAAPEFRITRAFPAPRPLVFRAFTEHGHLARWWGPQGFTVRACAVDARPGGTFHYGLQAPDGQVMWGKWWFREVVAPERLVVVASFSSEEGGLARHPFSPSWPLEVLSTTTLDEDGGRTVVTLHAMPLNASDVEQAAFANGTAAMEAGYRGTLDRLGAHLAQL